MQNPSLMATMSREEKELFNQLMSQQAVDPSTLYFYNTKTRLWRMETILGKQLPSGREGHKLLLLNNKIYVWGGVSPSVGPAQMQQYPHGVGNPDVWELDLSKGINKKKWIRIKTKGKAPYSGNLYNYSACSYNEKNSLYFFGGEMPGGEMVNTIHRFKVWKDGTGSWEEIIPSCGSAQNNNGPTQKETLTGDYKKDKKKAEKAKKKKFKANNGKATAYKPLERAQVALLQHGTNGEVVLMHGGEVNSEHSTELMERFNLRTHLMEACPLLGESPTLRSEHLFFQFSYNVKDPKSKKYGLICGGYLPEIGSVTDPGRLTIDPELQLYDETTSQQVTRLAYRNSIYRLDLETLVWCRLHDSFGKFVQAAEMFGIQRTDGSLVIGGGYGPMRVTEEDLDHSNGYGVLPESLWHTYDLTVDDCGDVVPHVLLHSKMTRLENKQNKANNANNANNVNADNETKQPDTMNTRDTKDTKDTEDTNDATPQNTNSCQNQIKKSIMSTSWAGSNTNMKWSSERQNDVFFYLSKHRLHWDAPDFNSMTLRGVNCYVFQVLPCEDGVGLSLAFDTYRGPINDYNAIVLDLAAPNILPSHGMLEEILEAKTDPEKYKNKSMDMKYNAFMKSTTGTGQVFNSYSKNWKNAMILNSGNPLKAIAEAREAAEEAEEERQEDEDVLTEYNPDEPMDNTELKKQQKIIKEKAKQKAKRKKAKKEAKKQAKKAKQNQNSNASNEPTPSPLPAALEVIFQLHKGAPEVGFDEIIEYVEDNWGEQELDYLQASARRSEQLRSLKEKSLSEPIGMIYTLKITIEDMTPTIHRTVTVTDTITLHQLHEQVIAPTVGWSSKYHAYAYRPSAWNNDGSKTNDWIGPKNSTANDARLMLPFYGGGFVGNSSKIELRHLLNQKNDSMSYVYDLGDYWLHKIELIDISERDELHVPFVILDGWGSCPPEDIGGPVKYCTYITGILNGLDLNSDESDNESDNESDTKKKSSTSVWPPKPEWRATINEDETDQQEGLLAVMREFDDKKNIHTIRFDPAVYDKEEAQVRMNNAIKTKVSRTKESTGFSEDKVGGKTSGNLAPDDYMKPKRPENENGKKELKRGTKACVICGITAGLNKCSRCEKVAYCGPEHQKQDWKCRHKNECVKKKAKKKKNK